MRHEATQRPQSPTRRKDAPHARRITHGAAFAIRAAQYSRKARLKLSRIG
jgi:hypothetical protein